MFGMEYWFVTIEMTISSKILGVHVHIRVTNKEDKFADFDYRYAK